VPKEYRIKRSCCTKIAVRENVRNLEKLVRKSCVMKIYCLVMLLCIKTHVQALEILDEMKNCGAGG